VKALLELKAIEAGTFQIIKTSLQVSLRMSKELPLVVGYRIVDMGEIK